MKKKIDPPPAKEPVRVYSARAITRLKAEAARIALEETRSLSVQNVGHILPRAYCVAKTGTWAATFAVCPLDRTPLLLRDLPFVGVANKTAAPVKPGDWCSLAYVSTAGCSQFYVVRRLVPE